MSVSAKFELTLFSALILTITYFFIGMIVPTAINTLVWKKINNNASAWLNIMTLTVINVIFFISLSKKGSYKVKFFDNLSPVNILIAIDCSVLFFLLLDKFLDPIFDKLFSISASEYQETLDGLRSSPVTSFIRVCIFAPVTEELLMRGYLLNGLQNKYGTLAALLVSAVLFALLHFNFVQTLSALICGLILGLLYLKTGSLSCCVLTHVLYNSISFFTSIAPHYGAIK